MLATQYFLEIDLELKVHCDVAIKKKIKKEKADESQLFQSK